MVSLSKYPFFILKKKSKSIFKFCQITHSKIKLKIIFSRKANHNYEQNVTNNRANQQSR